MSITNICSNRPEDRDQLPEGAYCPLDWNTPERRNEQQAIVLYQYAHGRVLSTYEHNMRDDSDFYAVVWNPEKQEPERVMYATTRGWSYPCNATVDATPEVLAQFAAYQERAKAAEQRRIDAWKAREPTKGKRVRVIAGRKLPKGTEGTVFWFGNQREFGSMPRGGYKAHSRDMRDYARSLHIGDPRTGKRVGIILADGSKAFLNATNVEVLR